MFFDNKSFIACIDLADLLVLFFIFSGFVSQNDTLNK